MLLVSHNLDKLPRLSDRVLWMEKGSIKKIGDPKTIIDEYKSEGQNGNVSNG